MRHCCNFAADEVYYLEETEFYHTRLLSIGFCPICKKPVAQLIEWRFDGKIFKEILSGVNANTMVLSHANEIISSIGDINTHKIKGKPFGWVYGLNKQLKDKKIKQYACDFYGNKELVKTL